MTEQKPPAPEEKPKQESEEETRHPAHPTDEDPMEHIGDVMNDPWADTKQKDWPQNKEDS